MLHGLFDLNDLLVDVAIEKQHPKPVWQLLNILGVTIMVFATLLFQLFSIVCSN